MSSFDFISMFVILVVYLFIYYYLLHISGHPRIIHRDIKSSNILLDNNFEARVCSTHLFSSYIFLFPYGKSYSFWVLTLQVSDFGLAKLALDANTHVTTRVMGTFG